MRRFLWTLRVLLWPGFSVVTCGLTLPAGTARWVAVYRARESQRPDAVFHDPFAERLAGDRGKDEKSGRHDRAGVDVVRRP